MASKIIVLAALTAVAKAGLIGAPIAAAPIATSYAAAPVVHHAPIAASYAAAPVVHHAPLAASYAAAPVVHHAPIAAAPLLQHAPISYSAPISYQAPISYVAPVAKVHAPLAYAAPVAKAVVAEEYDPNPQYSYGYDVQDGLTGDSKSHVENRNGDVVQGSYSLTDPDGLRRTVDYTADPVNGFNAVVRKEPLVAKAVVAAPAVAKIAAPLAYAAPVAKISAPIGYAAPVAKFASPSVYSTSVIH